MKLYKVLGPHGEAVHGGTGRWFVPTGKRPGKWMPTITDPSPCKRGYHLVTIGQLLPWLRTNATVYVAEGRGAHVDHGDKSAYAQARLVRRLQWSPQIAALFAADCAERVLPIFEREYPRDTRPRAAIAAARQWARGEIGDASRAAARDAAWDAAGAAAGDAAGAAAGDAAGAAAWDAAGAAARAAAGDAAGDAARAAAGAAERRWQTKRLLRYLNGKERP